MRSSRISEVACILDTDVVIDYLREYDYALRLLQRWLGEGLLAVSTLTHLEVYQGMKANEADATGAFLDGLVSVPVDVAVARRAGTMLGDLRAKGITVGIADAIIGATALQLGATLITNNVDHYPFPHLRLVRGLEDHG